MTSVPPSDEMTSPSREYIKFIRDKYYLATLDENTTEEKLKVLKVYRNFLGMYGNDVEKIMFGPKTSGTHLPKKFKTELPGKFVQNHKGKVGGVCAWIANEMNAGEFELTMIRLAAVAGMFAWGVILPLYLVAWWVKPRS